MLVGLSGAIAIILGYASALKLAAPESAVQALAATGLPGIRQIARTGPMRILAVSELLIAATVLLVGGAIAGALLALSFVVLTVVAVLLLRRSPGRDCGCFGSGGDPVSGWHVAVNIAGSVIGLLSVLLPQPSLIGAVVHAGGSAGPLVVAVLLLAYLLYQLMTALPRLSTLRLEVMNR